MEPGQRPRYLKYSDVNGGGGRGIADFTDDPAEAKRFPTHAAAFEAWREQSTVLPIRPDGKPNRPLTAFTVEVVELP